MTKFRGLIKGLINRYYRQLKINKNYLMRIIFKVSTNKL